MGEAEEKGTIPFTHVCVKKNEQHEWLVARCLSNAMRMARAERIAHLAGQRDGAGSDRVLCERGTGRRLRQSDLCFEAHHQSNE